VAALALGASAVQIGTAYLHCPESKVTPPHRAALKAARDDATVLTNVISGRPARGFVNRVIREMGPISDLAPDFPYASAAVLPLHAKAQAQGSGDFSGMLAGQAAGLGREMPAQALTQHLVQSTQALLRRMAG
jgi:nitronate monooxygenase